MNETLLPYEPTVTDQYLLSGPQRIRDVLPAVMTMAGPTGEVFVFHPEALQPTPYHLAITIEQPETLPDQRWINIKIVKEDGTDINDQQVGCTLYATLKAASWMPITSGYYNRSSIPSGEKPDRPIRYASGVVAPYDDAVAQAIANFTNKRVIRTAHLTMPPDTRIVKDFMKRGYEFVAPLAENFAGVYEKTFHPISFPT